MKKEYYLYTVRVTPADTDAAGLSRCQFNHNEINVSSFELNWSCSVIGGCIFLIMLVTVVIPTYQL